MRIFIAATAAFFISGCGANYGEQKAVSKLSIGEMIVSESIDRNATRDDIDRKIAVLSVAVPFDVHKTLGNGCGRVSIQETSAKQIAPDANQINASFAVGNDYFVDMNFIGRALNLKIGYLYDSPVYLMGVRVRHQQDVLSSFGGISGGAGKIVSAMILECDKLDGVLNELRNKFNAEKKEQLKKMQEKILSEFYGDFEVDPGLPEEQQKKEFAAMVKITDAWAADPNLDEEKNKEAFFKFIQEKEQAANK